MLQVECQKVLIALSDNQMHQSIGLYSLCTFKLNILGGHSTLHVHVSWNDVMCVSCGCHFPHGITAHLICP